MINELIVPLSELKLINNLTFLPNQLGFQLQRSKWDGNTTPALAILGLPEGRGSEITDQSLAPDQIRSQLYTLAGFPEAFPIVDLGNLKQGNSLADTKAALRMVMEELSLLKIPVLLLGGCQDLTCPILEGMSLEESNLIIVDDRIDYRSDLNSPADERFISSLPASTTLSLLAIQSYFIFDKHDEMINTRNAQIVTLGQMREGFEEVEPGLRIADLVSFDFGAIKASEAPGQYRISPNGLTGEESCQIAWYAGMATKPVFFALFGYSPKHDVTGTGAMQAAQIGWYFISGVTKRIDQIPEDEATDFEHYVIEVDGLEDTVTFLRHPISNRWWMEVPAEDCTLFPKRIPCSLSDYTRACNNEIPDRWWKYFNKTN